MGGDGVSVASVVYAILDVNEGNSTLSAACSGATCSGIRPGDSVSVGSSPSEPLEGSAKVGFWSISSSSSPSLQLILLQQLLCAAGITVHRPA